MPKIRKRTESDISAVFSKDAIVRVVRNQMVVSTPTFPRVSTSSKKKEANDRFGKANYWAKTILLKPEIKALYSKRIKGKITNAHTAAVADYLNAPKIKAISLRTHTGAIGDKIRVHAIDDFEVTAVYVTITDKSGKLLEKGPAIQDTRKKISWAYTLTVANTDLIGTVIEALVMDRPGNKTKGQVVIKG